MTGIKKLCYNIVRASLYTIVVTIFSILLLLSASHGYLFIFVLIFMIVPVLIYWHIPEMKIKQIKLWLIAMLVIYILVTAVSLLLLTINTFNEIVGEGYYFYFILYIIIPLYYVPVVKSIKQSFDFAAKNDNEKFISLTKINKLSKQVNIIVTGFLSLVILINCLLITSFYYNTTETIIDIIFGLAMLYFITYFPVLLLSSLLNKFYLVRLVPMANNLQTNQEESGSEPLINENTNLKENEND